MARGNLKREDHKTRPETGSNTEHHDIGHSRRTDIARSIDERGYPREPQSNAIQFQPYEVEKRSEGTETRAEDAAESDDR